MSMESFWECNLPFHQPIAAYYPSPGKKIDGVASIVEVRMVYIPENQNVAIWNLDNPTPLPLSPAG